MPLVVMPNVVGTVRTALLAGLPALGYSTVPVVGKVPDPRPTTFIRLIRTGGVTNWPVIDRAMLTIEAWDERSDAFADALAQAARAVVSDMRGGVFGGVTVYNVDEFSGPANVPDPESFTPRSRWTVEVSCRGTTP